jgi:3D (Asp-Asp-Asp) domain-containing protein
MWCKLSHFIVYILLSIFFVFAFFFSDPFIVKYGDKVLAETFVSKNVDNSKLFPQLPYVSCETKDNGRYVEYKEGIKVLLIVDGKRKTVYSKPCNVSTFLSKEHITLSKDDETSLPLNYGLKSGDTLVIKRINYKVYERDIPIKYRVVTESNSLVEKDVVVVWTPGEDGILRKRFRERYVDGVLTKKDIIWQKKIKEPVTEVIALGTAEFNGSYVKKYRMLASSYTPTVEECDGDPFTTASGMRVRFGIVAVDPKVIPLGTKLYVSGYGYAVAGDTGGAIKGMRIDCFFWRKIRNSNWRGGYINVYVLK